MTKKPDEIVADEIIKKLKDQGLIEEGKEAGLLNKLSGGDYSVDDWKLLAELSDDNNEGAKNAKTD